MSIQEGATYTLINVKSQTALDLSGGDGKSIIGFGFHGQGNQQWVLSKGSSGGWVFRSVATGKYLDIEGAAGDGTPVIASNCSREWDIWPDEENSNAFRVFIPGTSFNVDMSDHGNSTPGTPVTLWGKWKGINQTWEFKPV